MNEIYEFIKKCGTYYLATVEDGQPRNRPFGTVNIFEGKLYMELDSKEESIMISDFKDKKNKNFISTMILGCHFSKSAK